MSQESVRSRERGRNQWRRRLVKVLGDVSERVRRLPHARGGLERDSPEEKEDEVHVSLKVTMRLRMTLLVEGL
jgi:hypothetical protein